MTRTVDRNPTHDARLDHRDGEAITDAAHVGATHAVGAAPIETELRCWRDAVEERLHELLPKPPAGTDAVAAAMRNAVLTPGKRIRPLLVLMTARCLGREPQRLLDAACAIELVHAASLVLDDLPCMDDALLRRGQPALHRAFGEDVALLATVALLSRAYGVLAAANAIDAAARAEMVVALADAVGPAGLVRGQWRDLRELVDAATTGPNSNAVQAAEETNQLKTGSLFAAAFDLAAADARADGATRSALRSCADRIGQAFQLQDDLDDSGSFALPSAAAFGFQPDSRPTLVALLGREDASVRLTAEIDAAKRLLQQTFGERSVGLCRLIDRISEPASQPVD
ncbi:MAG: polyprenyl synthetase family protein [Burkholderiaceae bacterium]